MNALLESLTPWVRILSSLKDCAVYLLDVDGNVAAWNEGAVKLKGYTAAEAIGMHFSAFYTPEARAVGHPERELAAALTAGMYEEEGWRVRKDGSRFCAHIVITPIYDDDKKLCGFGKAVRDFTEQKQAQEQTASIMKLLEYNAGTDYLTGLDNRRSLDKMMTSATSAARRHQRPLSVAMIDFDLFKDYNDQHGHLAGDGYLRAAAAQWRLSLRPEDFLARYGGDEFVVILPDTSCDGARACVERLHCATPGPLTCSIGLAEWDGAETPNDLLGRADQAVYQAKAAGRDRLIVFTGKEVVKMAPPGMSAAGWRGGRSPAATNGIAKPPEPKNLHVE